MIKRVVLSGINDEVMTAEIINVTNPAKKKQ